MKLRNSNNKLLVTVILLFCGSFSFLSTGASAGEVRRLTIGTTMQVKSINIDDYYFGIMRGILTHKGIITMDENGMFKGDIADFWETEDAITWTFHLRHGLTWHDGKPVTANDIKFSIDYLMEKKSIYKFHFKLISKVTAIDEYTVEIKLSESNPRILVNLLVLRVLPEHIFKTVEDPMTFQGAKAATGCGPYVFDGFDAAAGIVRFKTYDKYYRGRPNVTEVVFRLFKNPDTMYMALKKGEIDLSYFYSAGTEPVHAASLASQKDIIIHRIPNLGVANVLFFNTEIAPFRENEMRRALSLSIDYDEMVRLFAGGFGSVPNSGFVPRGSSEFVETPVLKYDPEQAKKILKEMGYSDRDQNGILEKDGRDLEIEIVVRTDTSENMRIAELLQKRFAQIGVSLKIKPVDITLFRQISDKDRSHMILLSRTTAWGMLMWAGNGSAYFDSRNIGWANVTDTDYHEIVDQMNTAMDTAVYRESAKDLQHYYANHLPSIPLYWNELLQPCKKAFTGWKLSPLYGFLWEETFYNLEKED